jgi:hypothetical protein
MSNRAFRAALLTVVVLIAVLMLILTALTSVLKGASDSGRAVFSETPAPAPYLIRAHNGHIAVFFNRDDETPGIETMIETETLRLVDREKLQAGIEASTYEDVLKLLEDFGS